MRGGLSEEQEQIAVVQWFCVQYAPYAPWLHHSPNGGNRNVVTAKRLKAMGTRPGFPDLALYLARRGFVGLAIEMKSRAGRSTEPQHSWQRHLEAQGWFVRECRGFEQAKATLEQYVGLPAI